MVSATALAALLVAYLQTAPPKSVDVVWKNA
jgi:hypothetical protein